RELSVTELYHRLQESGLQYGPAFQGVKKLWRGNGEALGQVELPQALALEANAYFIHPTLLDSCLQVMAATLADQGAHTPEAETYLPSGVASVRIYDHHR